MEIYVRTNDDNEKDYGFQISPKGDLSVIERIFREEDGLAKYMTLRPSIFHKSIPSKFYKSVHPGILTEGACLLFHEDANKVEYLQELKMKGKPAVEQLWPCQLIVPKFEKCYKTITIYSLIMLFWLYTDLPDVISPTPGICLTNQISRFFIHLALAFDYPFIAEKLKEEIAVNSTGVHAQWLFFGVHIFKIFFLSLFFVTGLANPLTFNIYKLYKTRSLAISKDNLELASILKELGWVGSRRADYDSFRQVYYKYAIEKVGGAIAAYKAGISESLTSPGVILTKGEGFDTPLENKAASNTFSIMEKSRKFVLSEEYYLELEKTLKEIIEGYNGDMAAISAEVKKFRRFGLFECGQKLTELVNMRKEVDPKNEQDTESQKHEKKNR